MITGFSVLAVLMLCELHRGLSNFKLFKVSRETVITVYEALQNEEINKSCSIYESFIAIQASTCKSLNSKQQ